MTLYTKVVDPVFHNNLRCEFRWPMNELIHKDTLELGNLGAVVNTAGKLNRIAGYNNLIKRVSLYLGNELIDANYQPYSTALVNMLRDTNKNAQNVSKVKTGNSLPLFNKYTNSKIVNYDTPPLAVPTTTGAVVPGVLNLKDLLGFWSGKWAHTALPLFPLAYLKEDLRLVIEWETDPLRFQIGGTVITSIFQPVLLVDCIKDNTIEEHFNVKNLKYMYPRLEVENIYSQSVTSNNAPRVVRELVNSYNGKYLNKLCVAWNPWGATSADELDYTRAASIPNERIQLIVNGRNHLDYSGADTAAKKSMFFESSWGSQLLPVSAHEASVAIDLGRIVVADTANMAANTATNLKSQLISNTSLFGVNIAQRIDKLQIDWSSSNVGSNVAADNAGVHSANLVFIGETINQMMVASDGSVLLSS